MSSLSAKDRVSLCSFTFSDGRRCRTPRSGKHPHFCFDHAQKEARARARQSLGKDLAHYFSGDYLSACDLSTALGCLIPAVIRGDVKPKVARTVAYLAQTLLQSIHISQHEYINAFDTGGWRKSIRNTVNGNYNYRFPPAPHRSDGLQAGPAPQPEHPNEPQPQPQPAPSPTQTPQPAPSPHTSLPPTSTEFVQHVVAGLPRSKRPGSAGETGGDQAPQSAPVSSPTSARATQTPAPPSNPSHPASTPNKAAPTPSTQFAAPSTPRQEPRPAAGPQTGPSGLPVLAPLPPRRPGVAPVCGSS